MKLYGYRLNGQGWQAPSISKILYVTKEAAQANMDVQIKRLEADWYQILEFTVAAEERPRE